MLLNCGVGEYSWESLGLQGHRTSQSWRKAVETPILWPPDVKTWFIEKDRDAGKDWRQEEKRTTEDEMVGWHHWLNGHEFEHASGDGDGQGSLACCRLWDRKESGMTEWLDNNNTNTNLIMGHPGGGSWGEEMEGSSLFSAQFFCKPKSALKNKVY